MHAELGAHHQHLGREERVGDRREIPLRIVAQPFEQELVIGERLRRQDADGIAVVRRLGAGLAADIHRAAGPILHHDGLVPALAELLGHGTHENVAGAAGADRGERMDRPRRIILRRRRRADGERKKKTEMRQTTCTARPRESEDPVWIPADAGMSGQIVVILLLRRRAGGLDHLGPFVGFRRR